MPAELSGGLSHRHDAIADWLIAHPNEPQGACARALGYSQAWMSMIINSDIFQAYYAKRRDGYFDARVMPLRDKVLGLANRAVERLAEKVETIEDGRLLMDVADRMLGKMGYGAPQARGASIVSVGTMNVVSAVSADELAQARSRYREMQAALDPLPANVALSSESAVDAPGAQEALDLALPPPAPAQAR